MAAIDETLQIVLKRFNIGSLKPEQKEIFDALWCGKDCLAVLPTGFGKSLPYQLLSSMYSLVGKEALKTIICCPLLALMQDQVERLRAIPDVTAAYLGEKSYSDVTIREGKFDYLFGSPELLLGDNNWRKTLQTFNVSTIVVDEFHTITSWTTSGGHCHVTCLVLQENVMEPDRHHIYMMLQICPDPTRGDDDNGKAFRKWFASIGELRSMFPKASVLALSATCKKCDYKKVMKALNMSEDTVLVKVSPNKPNIKIVVEKIYDIESGFFNFAESVKAGIMPCTLIYCSSINDVAKVYNYLTQEVVEKKTYIGMYHSETSDETKSEILHILKSRDTTYVVIATNALGMGVDIAACHNVIIYGVPYTTVDLWQQLGRVGRDGSNATAVLLFNGHQLRCGDQDVRCIYKTASCRRLAALSVFLNKKEMTELEKHTGNHMCCDYCSTVCLCGNCSKSHLEILFANNTVHVLNDDDDSSSSGTDTYELPVNELSDLEQVLSDWEM